MGAVGADLIERLRLAAAELERIGVGYLSHAYLTGWSSSACRHRLQPSESTAVRPGNAPRGGGAADVGFCGRATRGAGGGRKGADERGSRNGGNRLESETRLTDVGRPT